MYEYNFRQTGALTQVIYITRYSLERKFKKKKKNVHDSRITAPDHY